jgi:hypothetical protein
LRAACAELIDIEWEDRDDDGEPDQIDDDDGEERPQSLGRGVAVLFLTLSVGRRDGTLRVEPKLAGK